MITYEWKLTVKIPRELWDTPIGEMHPLVASFFRQSTLEDGHTFHKRCATATGVANDVEAIESAGLEVSKILRRPIHEWETIERSEL